jgi:hypothetical protein
MTIKRTEAYKRYLADDGFEAFCIPIKFLEELKSSLEHTRRFTPELSGGPTPWSNKVCTTEGDIEEWLLKHGFWESDEYDGEVVSLIGDRA